MGGDPLKWPQSRGIYGDGNEVLLELPAGKETFGVVGQVNKAPKGKTHTSQPPKTTSNNGFKSFVDNFQTVAIKQQINI